MTTSSSAPGCLLMLLGRKNWSDDELDNNEWAMASDLAEGLVTWKEHSSETDDRREEV